MGPAEPEAAAPAPATPPEGRTVVRSTFLIGILIAAALGVAGAGILFTHRDQVTDTASFGAPYGIHEDQQGGRFGQRRSLGDADQDHGAWNGTGRHGQQGRADGRMPTGGGRHRGDTIPGQDGGTSTPAPGATSAPSPDATSSPEATQSPSLGLAWPRAASGHRRRPFGSIPGSRLPRLSHDEAPVIDGGFERPEEESP